jgi:flagellar basal-body rod modification protein FlgD
MTTPTVGSATTATNPQTSSQAPKQAGTGFGENFDTFLTLLTTQLKNQDPMSPLDTNQFTQQLVQFSSVEQSIKTNDQLKQLIALQSTNQMVSSLSLVGNTVEVNSDTTALAGGKAAFAYTMPTGVTAAALSVTDADGHVVYKQAADLGAGRHDFAWNGSDANGNPLPDGAYSMQAVGQKADGSAATIAVTAMGKVNGVSVKDGATILDLGAGVSVGVDKMVAVRAS